MAVPVAKLGVTPHLTVQIFSMYPKALLLLIAVLLLVHDGGATTSAKSNVKAATKALHAAAAGGDEVLRGAHDPMRCLAVTNASSCKPVCMGVRVTAGANARSDCQGCRHQCHNFRWIRTDSFGK